MRLKLLLPTEVLVEAEVSKINAEAQNGSFCLLPRHVDFVAALVPGLLSYVVENGDEVFLGLDEGALVKVGDEVLVSTRNAVQGPDLGALRDAVDSQFVESHKRERRARSAVARLESTLVRRLLEIQERR